MTGSVALRKHHNPGRQLAGLIVLLVAMYVCMRTLRFTNEWLNLAFGGLLLLVPFPAILFALRLRRRAKVWALVLLIPMGVISLFGLSALAIGDIPAIVQHRQLSRELGTLQQGDYSVLLEWQETAGGAVGPHGVLLEQRMTLLPGLYAFKPLDYFEGASEGSISAAGPNKIKLHIPSDSMRQEVDRIYSLKPRLYF